MSSFNKTIIKYHQAVAFLESLINLPIKDYLLDLNDRSYYLDRLRYLLKLLKNPHYGFKFIHITGTAGKGTVANYLHEILRLSGKKVGTYFSPHTTTSIERIKVNDLYISPNNFAKLTDYLKPALSQCALKSPYGHPSYFETFLALAFLYFKQKRCEYVILETGLGGTHDATNVIKKTKLALITNINYDHTEVLGKTLTAIARNKAGIIKKGSIFLTTERRPALLKIFQKRCQKFGAPYQPIKNLLDQNQELAKVAARSLGIKEKFIERGLKKAMLPCRFEIIQKQPLIILDGSHNPAKLKYLGQNLKRLKYHKLYLLLGLAADKDLKNSLKQIVPLANKVFLTRFLMPFRKTADLKTLYNLAKKIKPKLNITVHLDPWQALDKALNQIKANDCLLITGSFFLAGELRQKWISEDYILKQRKSF